MEAKRLLSSLSKLGCNFAVEDRLGVADPEKVLIESLQFFWSDKKVFSMLIALLKFRIHHVINTKRLLILSQDLDDEKKALLRVLAIKAYRHTGDVRYGELEKKLNKQKIKLTSAPEKYTDEFYIKRKGVDKDFLKVKLRVADFFEEQTEKKLKTLKRIYSENEWLRLRAISGADYRADTIYLVKSGLAKNQSEVANWLKCNKSSISRIWSSVKNIEELVAVL